MHQVHTQRTIAARMVHPGCAHWAPATRALGRVVARSVSCHRQRRSCRRPPLSRITAVPHAPLRAVSRVSQIFPQSCCACIATQPSGQAARLSRYTHLYRDPISQQPGPCARAGRVVGCIVAQPTVSRLLSITPVRITRPCRGPQSALRPHLPGPVSQYNPLYRDSNGQ